MALAELRPLSTGEILDNAFGLYRRHFAPLAVIVLVVSAVPTILELYVQASGGFLARPVLGVLTGLLNIVLSAIGTAAAVFIVSDSYLGRPVDAWDALSRAVPYIARVAVLSILTTLVVGLGLIVFLIPGLIFISALMVSTQALVLEEDQSPIDAMGRSWQLTKGFRWKVLALVVVTAIIVTIPSMAGGIAAAFFSPGIGVLTDSSGLPIGWYLAMVLGAVIQLLLYPLMYSVLTVLYYDLRVRKEGFDLEVLAQRPADRDDPSSACPGLAPRSHRFGVCGPGLRLVRTAGRLGVAGRWVALADHHPPAIPGCQSGTVPLVSGRPRRCARAHPAPRRLGHGTHYAGGLGSRTCRGFITI